MTNPIPRIGTHWPEQGGIYAGLLRGTDGQPDQHLIIATDPHADFDDAPWGEYGVDVTGAASDIDGPTNTRAMAEAGNGAARAILALEIDGHADFYIPSIRELSLARANVPEVFKRDWYWSSTQYSASLAWYQGFDVGTQLNNGKDLKLRARAVRRFSVIQ